MNLTPNPVILGLQVLPFVVTLLALKFLILDPMLEYLRTREGLLHGANHAAGAAVVDKARSEEATRLARAREEIITARLSQLKAASEQEKVILSGARKGIESELEEFRTKIQQNSDAARGELRQTADGLADQICTKLLA